MAEIQMRSKGIWRVFDEVARARLCESSGSEHSATENSADLSELVDSFLESHCGSVDGEETVGNEREEVRGGSDQSEAKEMLMNLIRFSGDGVRQRIRSETELARRSIQIGSPEGFKRPLMSWLRRRGFDAGLCKCRWEKSTEYPGGAYEYIDVVTARGRYIVEVSAASEFEIARPTDQYRSLLEALPAVLVCKQEELKRVLRLMCGAIRESLKKREMHVPPWRRNAYVQAKWFAPYKRTTNAVPINLSPSLAVVDKRLVGFDSPPASGRRCKGETVVCM